MASGMQYGWAPRTHQGVFCSHPPLLQPLPYGLLSWRRSLVQTSITRDSQKPHNSPHRKRSLVVVTSIPFPRVQPLPPSVNPPPQMPSQQPWGPVAVNQAPYYYPPPYQPGFPPQAAPNSSPVGIFWDIENGHVPKGVKVGSVVRRLRLLGLEYGTVRFMKAYGKMEVLEPYATDLLAAGVEVCPVPEGKEMADKAIIADTLLFAFDCVDCSPMPGQRGCVILVSGDKGFAPVLSKLSQRSVRTVAVAQRRTQSVGVIPSVMTNSADVTYDWMDLVGLSGTASTAAGGAARSSARTLSGKPRKTSTPAPAPTQAEEAEEEEGDEEKPEQPAVAQIEFTVGSGKKKVRAVARASAGPGTDPLAEATLFPPSDDEQEDDPPGPAKRQLAAEARKREPTDAKSLIKPEEAVKVASVPIPKASSSSPASPPKTKPAAPPTKVSTPPASTKPGVPQLNPPPQREQGGESEVEVGEGSWASVWGEVAPQEAPPGSGGQHLVEGMIEEDDEWVQKAGIGIGEDLGAPVQVALPRRSGGVDDAATARLKNEVRMVLGCTGRTLVTLFPVHYAKLLGKPLKLADHGYANMQAFVWALRDVIDVSVGWPGKKVSGELRTQLAMAREMFLVTSSRNAQLIGLIRSGLRRAIHRVLAAAGRQGMAVTDLMASLEALTGQKIGDILERHGYTDGPMALRVLRELAMTELLKDMPDVVHLKDRGQLLGQWWCFLNHGAQEDPFLLWGDDSGTSDGVLYNVPLPLDMAGEWGQATTPEGPPAEDDELAGVVEESDEEGPPSVGHVEEGSEEWVKAETEAQQEKARLRQVKFAVRCIVKAYSIDNEGVAIPLAKLKELYLERTGQALPVAEEHGVKALLEKMPDVIDRNCLGTDFVRLAPTAKNLRVLDGATSGLRQVVWFVLACREPPSAFDFEIESALQQLLGRERLTEVLRKHGYRSAVQPIVKMLIDMGDMAVRDAVHEDKFHLAEDSAPPLISSARLFGKDVLDWQAPLLNELEAEGVNVLMTPSLQRISGPRAREWRKEVKRWQWRRREERSQAPSNPPAPPVVEGDAASAGEQEEEGGSTFFEFEEDEGEDDGGEVEKRVVVPEAWLSNGWTLSPLQEGEEQGGCRKGRPGRKQKKKRDRWREYEGVGGKAQEGALSEPGAEDSSEEAEDEGEGIEGTRRARHQEEVTSQATGAGHSDVTEDGEAGTLEGRPGTSCAEEATAVWVSTKADSGEHGGQRMGEAAEEEFEQGPEVDRGRKDEEEAAEEETGQRNERQVADEDEEIAPGGEVEVAPGEGIKRAADEEEEGAAAEEQGADEDREAGIESEEEAAEAEEEDEEEEGASDMEDGAESEGQEEAELEEEEDLEADEEDAEDEAPRGEDAELDEEDAGSDEEEGSDDEGGYPQMAYPRGDMDEGDALLGEEGEDERDEGYPENDEEGEVASVHVVDEGGMEGGDESDLENEEDEVVGDHLDSKSADLRHSEEQVNGASLVMMQSSKTPQTRIRDWLEEGGADDDSDDEAAVYEGAELGPGLLVYGDGSGGPTHEALEASELSSDESSLSVNKQATLTRSKGASQEVEDS